MTLFRKAICVQWLDYNLKTLNSCVAWPIRFSKKQNWKSLGESFILQHDDYNVIPSSQFCIFSTVGSFNTMLPFDIMRSLTWPSSPPWVIFTYQHDPIHAYAYDLDFVAPFAFASNCSPHILFILTYAIVWTLRCKRISFSKPHTTVCGFEQLLNRNDKWNSFYPSIIWNICSSRKFDARNMDVVAWGTPSTEQAMSACKAVSSNQTINYISFDWQ